MNCPKCKQSLSRLGNFDRDETPILLELVKKFPISLQDATDRFNRPVPWLIAVHFITIFDPHEFYEAYNKLKHEWTN